MRMHRVDAPAHSAHDREVPLMSESTQWQVGIALGVVVIAVAAVIVITIVHARDADRQAGQARPSAPSKSCASRPTSWAASARINDSGVRILHAARALRKVAVGK